MTTFAFLRSCNPVWERAHNAPFNQDKIQCHGCGQVKSISRFHKDTRAKSGRQQPRKECRK